jgi:hypothetical protein
VVSTNDPSPDIIALEGHSEITVNTVIPTDNNVKTAEGIAIPTETLQSSYPIITKRFVFACGFPRNDITSRQTLPCLHWGPAGNSSNGAGGWGEDRKFAYKPKFKPRPTVSRTEEYNCWNNLLVYVLLSSILIFPKNPRGKMPYWAPFSGAQACLS